MTPELTSKIADANPIALHRGGYTAEPRILSGNDELTQGANGWFEELRQQFNNGDSNPNRQLNPLHPLATAETYLAALGASALMHLVSEDADKKEIGPATQFERTVLHQWAANEVRDHRKEPVQSVVLNFAAFAGLEVAMVTYMKKAINSIKQQLGGSPEATVIENVVASILAKRGLDVLHKNVLSFERFVAMNATAVDSDELLPIMKHAIEHVHMAKPGDLPHRRTPSEQ